MRSSSRSPEHENRQRRGSSSSMCASAHPQPAAVLQDSGARFCPSPGLTSSLGSKEGLMQLKRVDQRNDRTGGGGNPTRD